MCVRNKISGLRQSPDSTRLELIAYPMMNTGGKNGSPWAPRRAMRPICPKRMIMQCSIQLTLVAGEGLSASVQQILAVT